jgi:Beta propeller domain
MKSPAWLFAAALLAALAALPSPAGAVLKSKHTLKAFGSCSRFVHYARRHALNELRTRGVPMPAPLPLSSEPMKSEGAAPVQGDAPAAGQDFSTTNVQEAGVDEPDSVKTDGKTVYVAQNGRLFAIDAQSSPPKMLGSITIDGSDPQLLLAGDRLLVMSGEPVYYDVGVPGPVRAAVAPAIGGQSATLALVDVQKPSAMKVLRTMSVGGGYLSARMTGHTARVIFSATPQALPILQTTEPAAQRPKIARTTTPDWRPSYKLRRGRTGALARRALVRCTSIQRSAVFSGLNSLTVLTIDVDKGLDPVDSDAVMTDGQTVYASKDSLYVATQKAIAEQPNSERPPAEEHTEIHKFDISKPDETTYEGGGVVTGTLLNQYSMSEQAGYLRVASTQAPLWWAPGADRPSESFVTVLKQDGGALKQVGRVGGLGKGERIYAVRFLGDVGYVVTFRQVDPLYTIGLSDPESPKLLGSLDLLGYSAYLHPAGDGLLLGVGQSATAEGRTQGTQVSLFDISDPANPARLSNRVVAAGSSSSAEFDPHAFLWWDPLKLAVVPVDIYEERSQFSGAIGFHATRADGVTETGRLQHPSDAGYSSPITRSLVVGQRLFTVSAAGVMASDLATFAQRGFVALPAPQPPEPQPSPPSAR